MPFYCVVMAVYQAASYLFVFLKARNYLLVNKVHIHCYLYAIVFISISNNRIYTYNSFSKVLKLKKIDDTFQLCGLKTVSFSPYTNKTLSF